MIEKTIQVLEQQLLDPNFRDTQDVALLLADDFIEFGVSGCIYNKRLVLESLRSEQKINRSMLDFKIVELSSDVVLATYKVVNHSTSKVSLRSSVWKLIDNRWQMIFHQGTSVS